jgi:ABC-type sugar transport system permease subunit
LTVVPRRPWTGHGLRRERWHGYLFLAPPLIYLSAVVLLPLIEALRSSTFRIRGLNASFVGFGNYARVLADAAFWNSLSVSVRFTAVAVALHLALGLGLAMLVAECGRARTALRIALLTPWMVAPAIAATIWLWLLEPQFGVVNWLLRAAGLIAANRSWLGEPALAFGSIVAVDVWRGVPFMMLLLGAGLATIPREQYEAASIDGAGAVARFRHVTLPNLSYLLMVATTLDVINTVRQFDIVSVLTGGGPAGATEVLPALLYNTAFRGNDLGGGAAVGVLLLLIVLAFVSFYIAITGAARSDE